jgi:PAS domain S-box-containing protein
MAALVLAAAAFQGFYYARYRKFLRLSMYPTRLIIEIFPLVAVIPLGYVTAQYLMLAASYGMGDQNYGLGALLGFLWLLDATIFYYSGDFLNAAAYLSRSPFSCFLSKTHSMFFIGNSIFHFLHPMFGVFPTWANCFLIVGHFVMTFIMFRRSWGLIFVRLSASITFLGFLVAEMILDVVGLILYITNLKLACEIMVGIMGVLLVGALILMFVLVNKKEKALKISLAYNGVINVHESDEEITFTMSDADKQDRIQSLGLRSRGRCIAAILCGLRNGCDLFIDFSLIKFAVSEFDDIEMMSLCLRVMIFFPSEYRQTNIILREIQKERNHPISTRFLIHQIEKIRVIRQSSSSVLATEKLKQMRTAISDCEDYTKGLWLQKRLYYPSFGKLAREVNGIHVRSQEVIADFPHSVPHAEAFVEFLVECATQFTEAIGQKNHLDLLRSGRSRAIDYCFKAMIVVYPLYLKRRILDTKGAFVRRETKSTGIQSQTSSMSSSSASAADSGTGSSSLELDATLEEALGKQLLTESRTRLAVQGALNDKTAYSIKPLMIYVVFQLLFSVGIAAYGFGGFYSFFDNRVDLLTRGNQVTDCRRSLGGVGLTLLMYWGNATNHLNLTLATLFYNHEERGDLFIKYNESYQGQTPGFLQSAQSSWNALERAITALAATSDDNIYTMFPRIFTEIVNTTQCADGQPLINTPMNQKSIFAFAYVQAQISTGTDAQFWYTNNTNYCHFINTFANTSDALAGLRESDRASTTLVGEDDKAYLDLLQLVVPIAYAAIVYLPFPVVIWFVLKELRKFCSLIEGIPLEQKRAAVLPVMKHGDDQRKPQGEVQQVRYDSTIALLLTILTILFAGLIAINVMVFNRASAAVVDFENANVWSYFIGRMQPQVIEICVHTFQMIFVSGAEVGPRTNITTVDREAARVRELAARADVATSALLDGSEYGPSLLGIDPIVDDTFLAEECDPDDEPDSDFHSTYRCSHLSYLLVLYTGIVGNVLDEFQEYNGTVDGPLPLNIYHMAVRHLIFKMRVLEAFFGTHIGNLNTEYRLQSVILFICSLVISVIAAVLGIVFRNSINEIYTGQLAFLRRCSPAAIVADTDLLNYLLDVTAKEAAVMTPTQNIIHNSSGGIVCVGLNGTIESVSAGVTTILGFIPEQLLGQHAIILMSQGDGQKLQQRMEMMIRKECPRNFTDTVQCSNESDALIDCNMTLLGVDSGDGDLNSFVLILRDITNLVKQQEAAEVAKAQSEKLLYEILPRDIVNRINQQEKDITFVVKSATLMFIDIQKFSQYAANLTPQEIMGNLSLIFGGFDSLLPKYPLITKIKLIGDVYMCGAGLFNPDDEPEKHAEQMIRFALEALRVLEETNVKLGANLSVRIGINTGGPIIAGVLGTDKPVFDIIGDPINIAARLQSTCVPGRVQISEDTFSLVRGHGFMIEPRGDVFLKGKGNRPAYLISPSTGFALELSGAGSKVFSAAPPRPT